MAGYRPFRQRTTIPLEGAKLPLLDTRCAVGLFENRTGRNLRLTHIVSDDAFVKRYQ